MASKLGTVGLVRNQVRQYGDTIRSLGPWLILAIPVWLWIGRKAYGEEQERQRRLALAPVLKRGKH